jgi:hypothetical protein
VDFAEIAIEGSGVTLLLTLVIGVFAIVGERRRLITGVSVGLLLALIMLPFIAYGVARATNHQADTIDMTPPAYIVVTALTCAGFALVGMIIGAIAEAHHGNRPYRIPLPPADDRDMIDDVRAWLPWKKDGTPNLQ